MSLVIGRKLGEGFVLRFPDRPDIHVMVSAFSVTPTHVRLSVKADPTVEVVRDELVSDWRGRDVEACRSK